MDEKGLVKYQSKSGKEVSLNFELIRKYLVSGKGELVTLKEMMIFMGICKERGLNPFAKDCYLIKYTADDPAAIVTSIDYFRSRAKAQVDCGGWQKGIIVRTKAGEIRRSRGLLLEGETLLGGWFEGKPKGWEIPYDLEVNLAGYLKYTRDNKLTRFWKEENQPSQIAKVAESQGLRGCWPDEFQALYTDAEIGRVDFSAPKLMEEIEGMEEGGLVAPDWPTLNAAIDTHGIKEYDERKLSQFIQITAERNDMTIDDLVKAAVKDFPEFWKEFGRWMKEPEEKKPRGKAEGELTDEEIIDQFKGLKKTGLVNWEKMHRDKLMGFGKEVQVAFMEKWKKVMDKTYPEGSGMEESLKAEPKDEPEPEAEGEKKGGKTTVECPDRAGQAVLRSYCEDGCRDRDQCPMFD